MSGNTTQCRAIPCNTIQHHAIPCIINNCWRSVPLPCGQYNGHFLLIIDIFCCRGEYSSWCNHPQYSAKVLLWQRKEGYLDLERKISSCHICCSSNCSFYLFVPLSHQRLLKRNFWEICDWRNRGLTQQPSSEVKRLFSMWVPTVWPTTSERTLGSTLCCCHQWGSHSRWWHLWMGR